MNMAEASPSKIALPSGGGAVTHNLSKSPG